MEEAPEANLETNHLQKTQRTPNLQLKRERELRGWSQVDVAEKIGAQSRLITRWETGAAFPSPYYRQRLCQLFEKNAVELGLVKEAGTEAPSEAFSPELLSIEKQETLEARTTLELNRKQRRLFSRRMALLSLVGGAAVLAGLGGGISWFLSNRQGPKASPTPGPGIYPIYTYQTSSDTDVNYVTWSPHGTFIACVDGDQTVQILEAATGHLKLTYRGHRGFLNSATWSPDETRVASGGADHTIQVWDPTNSHRFLTYSGHTASVLCVALVS